MKQKVELLDNETPTQTASARIIADANKIEYEVDKRGRRIGVKTLTFIQIHKITKIVGGETALNQAALAQAMATCSAVEIDGDPIPFPGTNLQIEALMTRLDLDGINAVGKALERLTPKDESADTEIKN